MNGVEVLQIIFSKAVGTPLLFQQRGEEKILFDMAQG